MEFRHVEVADLDSSSLHEDNEDTGFWMNYSLVIINVPATLLNSIMITVYLSNRKVGFQFQFDCFYSVTIIVTQSYRCSAR